MNDKADKLAKSCLRKRWKEDVEDILECLKAHATDIDMLHDFHVMWNEIPAEAIQVSRKQTEDNACPQPAFRLFFDFGPRGPFSPAKTKVEATEPDQSAKSTYNSKMLTFCWVKPHSKSWK